MPRPPQQVPPDTLGGHIRAARKKLHYSLEEVAGKTYSTSLLSQIERNRIDPSTASLRYFAERLHLSFEELTILAQRQKDAGHGEAHYKQYETQRVKAAQAYDNQRYPAALEQLRDIDFAGVPPQLRWQLAYLRGLCHFELRQFIAAETDFSLAVAERPEMIVDEQKAEVVLLHLRYAATLQALERPQQALRQFEGAVSLMDGTTSVQQIADAFWCMSLIHSEQASQNKCEEQKREQLHTALSLAEDARVLCRSVQQWQRADLLTCQIGIIEQALGKTDEARQHLQALLQANQPQLEQLLREQNVEKKVIQAQANVCSAAACALAGVELEAGDFPKALHYVQQASETGKLSYILRRADAHMMRGRILDKMNSEVPLVEQAFRDAIRELEHTDRIAALVHAHDLLGRYLLKHDKMDEGDKELDIVRQLTNSASTFSTAIPTEHDQNDRAG